ncbi:MULTISPECIES: hypothetical protein [unclassified Exiguobacterium]|uniref:hypothetical protein n=1 Tax=unclassified Exiguobacterium TaxID=2644629 RepID=UPI00103FF411|nr:MULTISPECIES: hypothetical protein [unclassified Exiguobacterium]TCI42966.1 hypothetical protein EVJ31_13250 [Exiguobacterium sp. SH5S32]TCI49698.1 hypothetical protein EVJ25_13750 [Exiguobacterium sp. SH1S4]TCI67761.1 hypothetical protein EVJ23_13160 [Exiguobacterium sp. SH1S1]
MKDKRLRNLRELCEMYLCSSFITEEIISSFKEHLAQKDIRRILSEKTGRELNSIYRDERAGNVFNAIMLIRYWKAALEMKEELKNGTMSSFTKDSDPSDISILDIEEIIGKYGDIIDSVSELDGEVGFDEAVQNHFDVIYRVVEYYDKNPLPENRMVKKQLLTELNDRPDIRERKNKLRTERMKQYG